MYFTTLVKAGRLADKYLEALADSGKLVSRTVADHKAARDQAALSATYETPGNILEIRCGSRDDLQAKFSTMLSGAA